MPPTPSVKLSLAPYAAGTASDHATPYESHLEIATTPRSSPNSPAHHRLDPSPPPGARFTILVTLSKGFDFDSVSAVRITLTHTHGHADVSVDGNDEATWEKQWRVMAKQLPFNAHRRDWRVLVDSFDEDVDGEGCSFAVAGAGKNGSGVVSVEVQSLAILSAVREDVIAKETVVVAYGTTVAGGKDKIGDYGGPGTMHSALSAKAAANPRSLRPEGHRLDPSSSSQQAERSAQSRAVVDPSSGLPSTALASISRQRSSAIQTKKRRMARDFFPQYLQLLREIETGDTQKPPHRLYRMADPPMEEDR